MKYHSLNLLCRLLFVICFLFFNNKCFTQLYIEKLDEKVNTDEFDEIGPILDMDDRTLYFTRIASPDFINEFGESQKNVVQRSISSIFSQIAGKNIEDVSSSEFNQDIWIAEIDEYGTTEHIEHPGYPVNNAYPNSVCSIYPKENALVVLNQFFDDGSISEGFSKIKKKGKFKFEKPEPMEVFEYEDTGTDVNVCISQDGQHLFISLKRPDSSGKNDIYVSIKIGDNFWSKPEKLSATINTPYNETSPYITPDKKTLIFSSNRPGGLGKQDIYISTRLDYSYKNWSEPKLMEYPINTEYDEFLPYLSHDKKFLYFSSNRDGSSDIFRVDLERPEFLPEDLLVKLKIINAETGEITRGEIQWKTKYEDVYDGFFRTYTGAFELVIRKNQPYIFQVDKRGFISEKVEINPWDLIVNDITQKEVEIYIHPGQKLKEKKEYPFPFGKQRRFTLDEIYFQKGTDIVLSKSTAELDRLVSVLLEYENIEIKIEGHTDNVGDPQALLDLSLRRAKAIKAYLVVNGIEDTRVDVEGFGPLKALNANASEAEREKNRRVEIRITKE